MVLVDHIIATDRYYGHTSMSFFVVVVVVLHLRLIKRHRYDEVCATSYWKLAPEVEMCKVKQNKTRSDENYSKNNSRGRKIKLRHTDQRQTVWS